MNAIFITGLLLAGLALITFVDSASISATDCIHNGETHALGSSWLSGCDKNCTCLAGRKTLCRGLCPYYVGEMPKGCALETPKGECCEKQLCVGLDGKTKKERNEGCVVDGVFYSEGDKWNKGCELEYECKNTPKGYMAMGRYVCPLFQMKSLPKGCSIEVPEGECCSKVLCVGLDGTTKTELNKGCVSDNIFYRLGDKWETGCEKVSECKTGPRGNYVMHKNKCLTYTNLPKRCTLKVPEGECCAKPVCN